MEPVKPAIPADCPWSLDWIGILAPAASGLTNLRAFEEVNLLHRLLNDNESMATQHWLVKQEPDTYSWSTFVKDRGTAWTGVRNYQARNYLRAMRRGDSFLFYHSGKAREVVGLGRVKREAYPDATARDGDWSCVDLEPIRALDRPVSLARIKSDPVLRSMLFVRQPRLSVSPMDWTQFERLLTLGSDLKI